jgi:nucleotide-binding universal stress UspA family protein
MSALNATILASSRVAFSMGRDRWLPGFFSLVHKVRRTPHLAILATGVLLLVIAVSMPIESLGSAASLVFLLTFAFVNLSLIVIRRKHPELKGGFLTPLYPVIPVLGLATNVGLAISQFWFRAEAWYLVIGWMLLGYIVYQSYFVRITEKEKPRVLPLPASGSATRHKMRILVPIANPDNIEPLLDIAIPITQEFDGALTVVNVVKIPRQTPIEEGLRFAHHGESILEASSAYAAGKGIKIRTRISLAHRIVDGIRDTVEREESDLMIIGWRGYPRNPIHVFGETTDYLLRYNPCDIVVLKRRKHPFRKTLLATGGGPNAQLAAKLMMPLARANDTVLTLATAVPAHKPDAFVEHGSKMLSEIEETGFEGVHTDKIVLRGNTVAGALAKASKAYDLVVIGASREPLMRKMLVGQIPAKVARFSPASVMLVKRYEGPLKGWFKRTFG